MKKSLKFSLIAAVTAVMFTQPAHALFVNGGFEDGSFNGWSLSESGASLSSVIGAATPMLNGQTIDVDPYYGTYMARLQNLEGSNHTTTLSQSANLTAADLTETLYVGWGAMLIEPSNPHTVADQPYFSIELLQNGVAFDSFTADALNQQAGGWVSYGYLDGDAWYKAGVFSSALSGFAAGDLLTVSMTVVDCGLGGHGGAAFLDGIGTANPDNSVPEPATMLLFGTGIVGLAGTMIRRKEK